ncbi:MAG: GGDEF domain-containing protein [Deltaproteobacteria bacterium]|nr:GGDEF domain-containing protein [Deltaproteobacteria bacterium]
MNSYSITADRRLEDLVRENASLRAEIERLRSLSMTDALTGLPNRRYLEERLDAEVARAARHRQPLAVMVIDVDDFKRVNDTWGHAKGDEVLAWVAAFLRSQLRGSDVACRTGGDEFVVVLPATGRDGADDLAARLLSTLASLRHEAHAAGRTPAEHPVKLSIGVAALGPGTGDPTSLLAAADRAMYQVKATTKRTRGGRVTRKSA